MDVTLNNVLEGTRKFFMGVPKQAQAESSGQAVWPTSAPPPEEGTPAQSGAPAPTSRPPSAAAAPPGPTTTPVPAPPPRPPSEPIEPEPHIIHKATVMREAAEKRRELPEVDDEEEPNGTLSPPSHIIRKPMRTLPSPAPALAAPSPSPARPPSAAPLVPTQVAELPQEQPVQYRPPMHHVQSPASRPPDPYAPSRPPDSAPYSASRPPEQYMRYPYELPLPESGRNSHGSMSSPQPSLPARHSPKTYARMSSSIPQQAASRLREGILQSSPSHRYTMPPTQPPPPHNDRVPPIHHPQAASSSQRLPSAEVRSSQMYSPLQQRRETSSYARGPSHYDRQPTVTPRKYDPQQAYSGYRPSPTAPQIVSNHRVDTQHPIQYQHSAIDAINSQYLARNGDRSTMTLTSPHDSVRLSARVDYPSMSRNVDTRSGYHYQSPSTSTSRYGQIPTVPVPVGPILTSTLQPRTSYRTATTKSSYEYSRSHSVQTSPARSAAKSGYANQQTRMTVSVTSLVNEMNQSKQKRDSPVSTNSQLIQSKQKRESPLDLSVKTVKHSADSSTTQDDAIDSVSVENKSLSLQPRAPSVSNRHTHVPTGGYVACHKVDFAPNFNQYGERNASSHNYSSGPAPAHPPVRYNGSFDVRRQIQESFSAESSQHIYSERNKYSVPVARPDYVPKVDLTRSISDQRHIENRVRDDRNFLIEERKRPAGPIVSHIPEKIIRHETWTSDSRIAPERLSQSAREQQDLISRPVYSYNSHKQFEAYQNEHKRAAPSSAYREQHSQISHRYPSNTYPSDLSGREMPMTDYQTHYHERTPPVNRHQVIQKITSHRDVHQHRIEPHNRMPANKSVLSILRNSLETKQSSYIDSARIVKPDIIVIDDADDPVIEITDLTKENDPVASSKASIKPVLPIHSTPGLDHHIQMPKAVDSIQNDLEYPPIDNSDHKGKSPENDVASRIRTKAELKVMPPPQETAPKPQINVTGTADTEKVKLLPKSQKQHLFNQIREDLRLESVIKCEKPNENLITEVKTEPMNIDEIERDAEISIKTEIETDYFEAPNVGEANDDLDWASACDSFMEQLKSGCHKKKLRRRVDTIDSDIDNKADKLQKVEINLPLSDNMIQVVENQFPLPSNVVIKQEPIDEDGIINEEIPTATILEISPEEESGSTLENDLDSKKIEIVNKNEDDINVKEKDNEVEIVKKNLEEKNIKEKEKKVEITKKSDSEKIPKFKTKVKLKTDKTSESISMPPAKKEGKDFKEKKVRNLKKPDADKNNQIKTIIKEELESTDDDEPLIKSKLLKEKEQNDRLKYQLLKDFTEKSAYVKLEFCDVDVNKNTRNSIDVSVRDKEERQSKGKLSRQSSRSKMKSLSSDNNKEKKDIDSSTDSDDDMCVASRLRMRKCIKSEDGNKPSTVIKSPVKSSPKKLDNSNTSNSSTPVRKAGFGDGSDFHPGWEEELFKYKRSLRMPARLIAIPRGRSKGPFARGTGAFFKRGTTSLPDLDAAPLSPAPSSAPSAATDDLYARQPDKLTLDSDLESNSSYSAPNRLHYDSEASTSTIFSTSKAKKKNSSIVDVLIKKCGKKDENIKKKSKREEREDKTPKVMQTNLNATELLPTPSLGLVNNNSKGILSAKKEKMLENISYLGAFRKETVTNFRHTFINNTDGLIGATEEFAAVVLKTRTRTESKVLKHRATIREVFGDERPASAPPISYRENSPEIKEDTVVVKKEPETKPKLKPKKITKDKLKRSSSIRDGLRSTKSLKRNDAKGRLLRLKKRNSMMKTFNNKRTKGLTIKHKNENRDIKDDKSKSKYETNSPVTAEGSTEGKKRFRRLVGRRKFSSGFDYIRKKKKIIRREDTSHKIRRPTVKPNPESVHDIHKEIKSWFINKSIGETHLHRAARLGYTDCVAYCLEKMEVDPSSKDNAGFTPLHVASQKGHVRIARLLLQYGANVSAAAQGGIRPLHEACENCHVEVIRLLLSYGADPLLGTYAGQTPEELTEGPATRLLQLHIADVQGLAVEPWRYPPLTQVIDRDELGCDPLSSPPPASPPPPPDATLEIQCTEAPLPPFYSLRTAPGQPADGLWCLLQDVTNLLQIKSKENLLKQIHCGSGSPKELLREIRTQEFLERAQCHQLLCAGEKVNVRASKVALIRVTDKLRQLLKIETVLVS